MCERNWFCGRCGVNKTAVKGATCESCRERARANDKMWAELRCSICGREAIGFNIFGAFCSDKHYLRSKVKRGDSDEAIASYLSETNL